MNQWKMQQIKNFKNVKVILGQSPPSKSYNDSEDGLPFLQGKAEFGMIYPTPEKYTSSPLKIAEKNDILISVRAPVGDVNLAPYKLCIGRGLAALKITKDDPRFYFYWFQLNQKLIENMGTGSTFKAITGEQINKIELPIVNLPEQKAIAEILSTVDEAIQKADEAIKKTERIKQGVMHKLLTEGIGHKEFKQTKIGKIPKEWKVLKCEEIFELEYGKGLKKSSREQGKYPVVGSSGIIGYHSEYLTKSPGIVVGRKGTIGGLTYLLENFWPIDTTYFISLKTDGIQLRWLYYALSKINMQRLSLSDVVPGLKRELVYKQRIALPLESEQKQVISIMKDLENYIALSKSRKQKLQRIKLGLMNDLLTGKKRVRLN